MACPLCENANTPLFYSQTTGVNWELYGLDKTTDKSLGFFKCGSCDLIFKDPIVLLNSKDEKSRYDQHKNTANDPHYEEFLSSLVEPLSKHLKNGAIGLDFGCGVEPAIQSLFKKKSIECISYDPYFHKDESLLKQKYDFVTVCETAEHFYTPKKEFELLFSLLKTGGTLGVKTGNVPADFASWWYHKDPTHVVFYSKNTFNWISKKHSASPLFLPKDVTLFHKPMLE